MLKKIVKRCMAMLLTVLAVFSTAIPAQAALSDPWPRLQTGANDGRDYNMGPPLFVEENENGLLLPIDYAGDYLFTPIGPSTISPLGVKMDFSNYVTLRWTAADGRTIPANYIANKNEINTLPQPEYSEAIIAEGIPKLVLQIFRDYWTLYRKIEQEVKTGNIHVGGYHPVHANMLYSWGNAFSSTAFIAHMSSGGGGGSTNGWSGDDNDWQGDDEEKIAKIKTGIRYDHISYKRDSLASPAHVKRSLEFNAPFWLNYVEENRISEPEITSFAVGSVKGAIDKEAGTVTLRFPAGTNFDALPTPVIETVGWTKANHYAGSLKTGTAVYQVVPYDEATGITYDGVNQQYEYGNGYGVDLSRKWTIRVEEGDPYNMVTSFAIKTADGVTRYATIDEDAKTITLNLPQGADLTALTPIIEHTGMTTNMDSGSFDFSSPQTLSIINSEYSLQTNYTVTITANISAENNILSYKIGDSVATINDTNIAITVPYGTNLAAVTPDIQTSEFATIKTKPDSLAYNTPLIYVIKAENSDEKTYTVTITQKAAETISTIKSFRYGSVEGAINSTQGTITMTLPGGVSKTFAPTIELTSQFATVTPASGVAQDFSNPVKYTVKAQNGATRTYTVTVTFESGPAPENPYLTDMNRLLANIINAYPRDVHEDWEWMNLGFYNPVEKRSAADLPFDFDIAYELGQINNKMTDYARVLMMLTAMGVNATKLDQVGGPFTVRGQPVTNLVAELYNYAGADTINGPIFSLIALDMGRYTIPADAVYTREKLLDTILAHKYGSDGFGIDMVAMLMQSIAPYQNDPVYGAQVREKLNEGLDIILGNKTVSGVSPMTSDFFFGGSMGGAKASESADQVICALSAMGIDIHTDPRLSDGNGNSVLTSWLTFANISGGYFHHTDTVLNNSMATYQGCYALQWYLNFLSNGGAGNPYSLYYDRLGFDFSEPLSVENDITGITFDGKNGTLDPETNTFTITLPAGTSLSNITPQLTLSPGATLISPKLPFTFVAGVPQPFIVQAADGETRQTFYIVFVLSDEEEGSGAELFSDSIKLQDHNMRDLDILDLKTTINGDFTEIELTVNEGVDTSRLRLFANLSYGATASVDVTGKTNLDLSDWLEITVTSQDGSRQSKYRIRAVNGTPAARIESFSLDIDGTVYNGVIGSTNVITVGDVPASADISSLVPAIAFSPEDAICLPSASGPQDFRKEVYYTVKLNADDPGTTYTVVVKQAGAQDPSNPTPADPATPQLQISSFKVLGVSGVIDHAAYTITVTLNDRNDVSNVAPVVEVPSGCSVSPVSGQVVNLTTPIIYTVANGSESRDYTVTVNFVQSTADQMWDRLAGELGGLVNIPGHQDSRPPSGGPKLKDID